MSIFSGKKLLVLGFVVMLLAAIPLTVYFLQQQQETRSRATPATVLSFTPTSSSSAPIKVKAGDSTLVNVRMNPGSNVVSFLRLYISYDSTKLTVDQSNTACAGFCLPQNSPFSIIAGPEYGSGTIAVTLSGSGDGTNVVSSPTDIATVAFKAIGQTTSIPTQISFSSGTEVRSGNCGPDPETCENNPVDSPTENVLSSTSPAYVLISDTAGNVFTPTPVGGTANTPTPTISLGGQSASSSPTPTPNASNVAPVCSSFSVNPSNSGTVPFAATFTANGTDSDGSITKATFNFGDGPVQDVTYTNTSTSSASTNATSSATTTTEEGAVANHTYTTPGTYTASVVLTDDNNAVSEIGSCQQTITVIAEATPTVLPTKGFEEPQNVEPPGPTGTIIGFGILGVILSIVGGIIFFAL